MLWFFKNENGALIFFILESQLTKCSVIAYTFPHLYDSLFNVKIDDYIITTIIQEYILNMFDTYVDPGLKFIKKQSVQGIQAVR